MFPRYRFNNGLEADTTAIGTTTTAISAETSEITEQTTKMPLEKATATSVSEPEQTGTGQVVSIPPRRTYIHQLALVHFLRDDKTTWFQYFRRPFYLFAFPNIVLAGMQFAFGSTAGIVSFNTISEIMTDPPYNWKTGPTGLIFLAALVGNFIGYVK